MVSGDIPARARLRADSPIQTERALSVDESSAVSVKTALIHLKRNPFKDVPRAKLCSSVTR